MQCRQWFYGLYVYTYVNIVLLKYKVPRNKLPFFYSVVYMKDVKKTKVVLTLQRIQTGIVLSVNVFQNQNWTKRLIFISINQPQAWTLTSKGIFFFFTVFKGWLPGQCFHSFHRWCYKLHAKIWLSPLPALQKGSLVYLKHRACTLYNTI